MWANGSSRAPNLLRVRRTPLATARTNPCSRVSKVTIRSASPSLCWRSTTARSRYNRIDSVSHCNRTEPARSSDELVRRSLHSIDASQSTLNAFRVVLTEQALADAAEADRRRAAGERAALLGVPIAVKDDTDVAGVPTAFGTEGHVAVASE